MMNNSEARPYLSPEFLAQVMGKPFPPTAEQADVIKGGLGPKLVVAGAGAGKTETMASRVVSLVANGQVRPEQVLGLTFTRKAAQQLQQRIRRQLLTLRESGLFPPGSEVAQALETIAPTVTTYDAYAGQLVREYGLLVPVEPSARIITDAERYAIAHDVVSNFDGELFATQSVSTVVQTLIALTSSMDNALADPDFIRDHAREFIAEVDSLDKSTKNGPEYAQKLRDRMDKQILRTQYLPLVQALQREQAERQVMTFGEQMSIAAKLARQHPLVGQGQRERFRVVMLDEYQDTSYAQRVLLRSLFGGQPHDGLSVTAVGDPMQAIYGWRGATAENLAAFVEDFPQSDGSEAPKDQLTTSWRNPSKVLELANDVASDVFAGGPRPVDALEPRPGAEVGDVSLAYFDTADEEMEFVSSHLKECYDQAVAEGTPLSAAVLVRANSHSAEVAQALEAKGVPYEVVGLGGLLLEPEVQDLVALATMLVRPQDTNAALRILAGPACGLGVADIMALKSRAVNLAGAFNRTQSMNSPSAGTESAGPESEEPDAAVIAADSEAGDPVEQRLRQQMADLTAAPPDQVLGLADAVADLGERERYSPEGLARIEELSARLRHLRTYSLSKPLGDLFADIEALFNIRTEVLANNRPGGTAQLDRFADVVAGYQSESLLSFLDFLDLALEHEDGLDPGEVPTASDRVQIMTAHKSKGLEFEHVCVVHADSATYKAKASTFLTNVTVAPSEEDVIDVPLDAVKRSEFLKATDAFIEADRQAKAEESARLFYVAATRTEKTLTITGSGTNGAKGKAKKGPYAYLDLLRRNHPELVAHWSVPEHDAESEGRVAEEGTFPYLNARPSAQRGAKLVAEAMDDLPAKVSGETFDLWEADASALIEEYGRLNSPVVEVELPGELTASDLVAVRADPLQFARRQRRPVPFKPNSYAKRGTAFHAWLEELFGGSSLLGDDELPGMDETPAEDLAALKEAFTNSEWANRTPEHVETPFEITIGTAVVRGRMDAVFTQPDGSWLIVDWKTGRPPKGKDMRAAEIQLAVYAEAWRRVSGTSQPVRAAFYYVADDYLFEPRSLPDTEGLAALLKDAVDKQDTQ